MIADAMLFAILSALLISLVPPSVPQEGIPALLLSTQVEDAAQAATLHADDVVSACVEHRPGALQDYLSAAVERFGFACFELGCPDGSTVIIGGTRCSAPVGASFSASRVVVSDDGERIFEVGFHASR